MRTTTETILGQPVTFERERGGSYIASTAGAAIRGVTLPAARSAIKAKLAARQTHPGTDAGAGYDRARVEAQVLGEELQAAKAGGADRRTVLYLEAALERARYVGD